MPAQTLRLGTDGAARKNPGPAGWAWVDEHGNYAAGSWVRTTNNIAELTAIKMALTDHPDVALIIESDSQYSINCITKWAPAWRKDPAKAEGKKNLELIYSILDLIAERSTTVTFEWVRGHDESNAHPLNTAADALSARFADTRSDQHHVTGAYEIDWARKAGAEVSATSQRGPRSGSARSGSARSNQGSRGKKKRTGAWATQTEIGKELGLSAIAVGKKLESRGLRAGGRATQTAVEDGVAKQRHMKGGVEFFVWHRKKVLELLGE